MLSGGLRPPDPPKSAPLPWLQGLVAFSRPSHLSGAVFFSALPKKRLPSSLRSTQAFLEVRRAWRCRHPKKHVDISNEGKREPIVRLGARRLGDRFEGRVYFGADECRTFVMSSLFFCYRRCLIFVFCSESRTIWSGPIFCLSQAKLSSLISTFPT